MNKILSSLIFQFRDFYKNLGPTKRLSIIASTLIVTMAVVVVGLMATGSDYAVLLTNVPSEQMPFLVEKLKQKNVAFHLGDDGKTISVPKEILHATQMALMAEVGSGKLGNVGLEIFEKQDFGMNSYAQKINYQRALQGELMRSINTLNAVKQSKVILALPNKKNFLEEGGKPTASIVVELYPGKSLTPEQVRGIQYLAAAAVEGLEAEKVAVLDDRGKMLSRAGDGSTSGSAEILDLKRKIEADLEERIDGILSRVVGNAKVMSKVDAALNHKVVQSVEESVDPEKTAIRSQQTEEEFLNGSRTNPSGIPGSRANLPGAEDGGQVGFKQDVKKELKTMNYEVPKTVRNIRETAGSLERLTVAVVVDGIVETIKKEDGTEEAKWSPRSSEDLAKYETLVKNAIGFNSARGDSVKIETMQFVPEDFTEATRLMSELKRKQILHFVFQWGLVLMGLGLFFFIVVRPFMQWITDSFQDSVDDMLPRTLEELEQLQAIDSSLPGMTAALPVMEESIDPDKAESELLKDRIMTLMGQDEEKVGSAFGMWLIRRDQ